MWYTLITGRQKPDLDAVSSACAYSYYLNTCAGDHRYYAAFAGEPQYEVRYVLEHLGVSKLFRDIADLSEVPETFILTDYSERSGISPVVVPEKVIEVIDHRNFPTYEDFKHAKFRIEYVGAAATLVAETYYFDTTVSLPLPLANMLYCAIFSNTLNFGARMCGYRDVRMKERLESIGVDKSLPERMFLARDEYAKENMPAVLRNDAKLSLLDNGLFVDYLQIEACSAEWFVEKKDELSAIMSDLHDSESALCLLHIHDIIAKKTYIMSNYTEFFRYLAVKWFPGYEEGGIRKMPTIYMRKDTAPMLKDILEHIDKSWVLNELLS